LKPSEILRKAAEKIAAPEKWAKLGYAFNATGEPVDWDDHDAVCWCLTGATAVVADKGDAYGCAADRYLRRVIGAQPASSADTVSVWNDRPERTHSEVLAALAKAAELAESEGQ
jgi:hypothetical protein